MTEQQIMLWDKERQAEEHNEWYCSNMKIEKPEIITEAYYIVRDPLYVCPLSWFRHISPPSPRKKIKLL